MGDCYASLADQLTDEQEKNKKLQEAANNYGIAINIDLTYREPYLNLAKIYIKMKDYSYAEFIIKRGLQKSYRHFTWLERDISWSYEPWDLLCLATYYGGKVKDSVVYAAKALMFEPTNERLSNNLKLCTEALNEKELTK
jgi:tetratricopeptide (TPR) repeat protein